MDDVTTSAFRSALPLFLRFLIEMPDAGQPGVVHCSINPRTLPQADLPGKACSVLPFLFNIWSAASALVLYLEYGKVPGKGIFSKMDGSNGKPECTVRNI
jgi:hypothetical protein